MDELILYCALAAGFLPVCMYYILRRVAKEVEKSIIPFLWLIALASAYEIIGTMYLRLSSAAWFSIYDLLEFCALLYFLQGLLRQRFHKSLYLFVMLFILAYAYMNWCTFGGLRAKAVLSSITFPFVFAGIAIWLNERFQEKRELLLATPLSQWLGVLGVLSYYTLTYFLYLLGYSIYQSDTSAFPFYWQLNVIITLAFRITLCIAVWKMDLK